MTGVTEALNRIRRLLMATAAVTLVAGVSTAMAETQSLLGPPTGECWYVLHKDYSDQGALPEAAQGSGQALALARDNATAMRNRAEEVLAGRGRARAGEVPVSAEDQLLDRVAMAAERAREAARAEALGGAGVLEETDNLITYERRDGDMITGLAFVERRMDGTWIVAEEQFAAPC